jgi:hypothetical protein
MRTKITIFLASLTLGIFALPMTAMAVPGTSTAASETQGAAAAASETNNPGTNLSTWLKGWVTGLFGVIVGVVGLGAVAKRSVGEGLALLLVALIVGGFVIDPGDMNSLTHAIWAKIAA